MTWSVLWVEPNFNWAFESLTLIETEVGWWCDGGLKSPSNVVRQDLLLWPEVYAPNNWVKNFRWDFLEMIVAGWIYFKMKVNLFLWKLRYSANFWQFCNFVKKPSENLRLINGHFKTISGNFLAIQEKVWGQDGHYIYLQI